MAFESMTISFVGAIKGCKEGSRSAVGLDACHLNGKCGGVLMDATGLDGQNGLVTLGIGVFPAETIEDWTMSLTDLKSLLLSHEKPLTFILDRQKGLLEAVLDVFPDSYHRYYWRHLYNNFKKQLRDKSCIDYCGMQPNSTRRNITHFYFPYSRPLQTRLICNILEIFLNVNMFMKYMEDMKKENPAAVVYLEKDGFESWSRDFFDDTSKCEHLNNNFSESFNSMAKNLRDKPICRLGILYNQLVMSLFHKRRKESAKWNPNGLVSTAMKLIGKLCKLVGAFKVDPYVSGKLYEVINEDSKAVFIVNLEEKQCSCLQWQLRGFVSQHDVCCLKSFRSDWTKYFSHYYSVAAYRDTYAQVAFHFLLKKIGLEEHEKVELESSIKIRKLGRTRVKRRRAWDEPKVPTKVYSCSRCKSTGHNKTTCQGGDVGNNPKAKRQRTQVDGATFTSFDRPAPQKKQSSQPSGIRKTAVESSYNAKKSPAKASTTSKKKNMSQTKK
ncbi:uncharacterized protein LOC113324901 [Papaver somniferum]|uniref:uncharacterized protein LOC113324901 n=1 Tax=Papaver somniferum TaxID=3469 RepID=UPI000E6F9637|nr:uncharacterized protein LOC113324901 [Papaver somniferum]